MPASDSFERFDRTQRGPWVLIMHAIAAGAVVPAIMAVDLGSWRFLFYGLVALFELLAFGFLHLNLRDEGERLEVRFGPIQIPYCHTTIMYAGFKGHLFTLARLLSSILAT